MELIQSVVIGIITGAFSAGTIWGVLSTRMAFLQRDVIAAHSRIDRHEDKYHQPKGEQ